jgi:acetaldehyde dehydrogenase (acetylating)
MNLPSFHDGHFDGLRIGPNKMVNLFLRTEDGKSFIVMLEAVDRLILSEIQQVDIILDLVFRSAGELTRADMAELYSVDADALQATD